LKGALEKKLNSFYSAKTGHFMESKGGLAHPPLSSAPAYTHTYCLLGFDAMVMIPLLKFLMAIYGHCGTTNYYLL
jgi:hypothetical protein